MKSIARKTVRGSKTGRPIMVLLDLLGRKMTLRVLWEISNAKKPLTFRQLQKEADTNPAVLNARLKELRIARLVDHVGDGYVLTDMGRSLSARMRSLHGWADAWASQVDQI